MNADTTFSEDLGVPSLELVELVMELEEEFDVSIPDEAAEKIRTLGDAIRYVRSHCRTAGYSTDTDQDHLPTGLSSPPQPKRRWYQFSLRTLLVFVALCAIACSWLAVKMQQARRQQEAVALLEAAGWMVSYDYEFDQNRVWMRDAEPPGPPLLRKWVGIDFFANVVSVEVQVLDDDPTDPVDDDDMVHIAALTNLEGLAMSNTELSDVGLERIAGLTKLRRLWVVDSEVTDGGLVHLRGLAELRRLGLAGTKVSDAGLVHLRGLTNLEVLNLWDTDVTDAGLEHLHSLSKLRDLTLYKTRVTEEGVRKLKQALPACSIGISVHPVR